MGEVPKPGELSRRDALRRGAILGGTTLWATPIVQSLTVRPAFAQATPAPPGVEGPSYIAMNVVCSGTPYVLKLECNGTCAWDDEPGKFPSCDEGDPPVFSPEGEKADGDDLGFTFSGPDEDGCVIVVVPENCTVQESSAAVKKAQTCCPGETGTGPLTHCPPSC